MASTVYSVGINDSWYPVNSKVDGVVVRCPFYVRWCNMLKRCYSKPYQDKYPTYIGCSVDDEWLTFSNFRRWMESQDWRGNELDKDLIQPGNKVYSKDKCVFLDQALNSFIQDRLDGNKAHMCGVDFYKKNSMFRASTNNNMTRKKEFLGFFTTEHSAHLAWRKRKHELACQLADMQSDDRVANALRSRYAP